MADDNTRDAALEELIREIAVLREALETDLQRAVSIATTCLEQVVAMRAELAIAVARRAAPPPKTKG